MPAPGEEPGLDGVALDGISLRPSHHVPSIRRLENVRKEQWKRNGGSG